MKLCAALGASLLGLLVLLSFARAKKGPVVTHMVSLVMKQKYLPNDVCYKLAHTNAVVCPKYAFLLWFTDCMHTAVQIVYSVLNCVATGFL